MTLPIAEEVAICRAALAWAAARDYTGWNKFDALSSPLLRAASLGTRWGRLVATQIVKRSPWNLRPLLAVPRLPNMKGWALFAQAHAALWTLQRNEEDRAAAQRLLDGLVERRRETPYGWGWGYPHPWQDWGFYAEADSPNRVVTAFAVEALLDAGRRLGTDRYLDAAARGGEFLARAPRAIDVGEGRAALTYVPEPGNDWRVVDVSALAAAALAELAAATGDRSHLPLARSLVRWVLSVQTPQGAWFYADPPEASPIRHDNYHTGFILDALLRYARAAGEEEPMAAWRRGIVFYAERLFDEDGAPRWQSHRRYPRDVHGSAQGILTFSRAAEVDPTHSRTAGRIARWTLANLYVPGEGRFIYQRGRFLARRFTLMRWCQAWMARALAAYAQAARA